MIAVLDGPRHILDIFGLKGTVTPLNYRSGKFANSLFDILLETMSFDFLSDSPSVLATFATVSP